MRKILRTKNWSALNKVFQAFGGPVFDALAASHLGFKHAYRQAHIAVAMYNAQLAIDNADSQYWLQDQDLANHDNFRSIVTEDKLVIYWTSRSNNVYEIRADRNTQEVSIEFEEDSSLADVFKEIFEEAKLDYISKKEVSQESTSHKMCQILDLNQ